MSSIKTTQLDGDVSVGRNVAMGGNAEIAGRVHIGHNLKVDGWLDAPNIISGNKGVFLTLDALRAAYPEPRDGWSAGVGASTPFAAYTGIGGEWVATGGTIDITVGMSEIEQLQKDVEDIATELQSQSAAAAAEATARAAADADLQEQVEVKAEGEFYNLYDKDAPVYNGYVNTNGGITGGAATDNKYLYTKIPIDSDTVYVLRMYAQSDSTTVYAAIQDKNGVALDIYNDSYVKYPYKYVSFVKVGRSFCVKATGEGLTLLVTVKFDTADYRELLFVGVGNVEPEDYIAHECLAVSPVKGENTSRFIYKPDVGATSSVLSYFDENNDFSSEFIVRRDRGVSGGVSECFNLVSNVLVNRTTNQRVAVGNMSDDICPYNGSLANYIGANHGIMQTYKCTVSGHGKTFADIGSLWNNGSNNFIIADIIDSDNILLVSENQKEYPVWKFVAPTKTTYQHVEGAAHTSSFTVSNTAVLQGKPVIKIEETRIFVDGKEIDETAKTYLFSREVKICQNYMIANPASIIEKLRLNVGTFTDHPVFSELEDVEFFVKLSISYIYTDARHLYIATTLAFLQDTQNGYFGFSQFSALENPNTTRLYVPKLLPLNNPDYRTNPAFTTAQAASYTENYWEDAEKLPDRFVMTNDTVVYSAGYLFDIGIGGEKRKNFTGNALTIPTTRKLYFRGLDSNKVNLTSPDGNSSRAGEAYSMVVFRHYAPLADENKEVGVFLSNIFEYNNSLYIYIDFNAAGLYTFDIPGEYVGKEVEVYETRSNVKLLTKIASDTITVKVDEGAPMYGYFVAKISRKQDILSFDDTPTTGSSNPVKSSGVKAALEELEEQVEMNANAITVETTARQQADTNLQTYVDEGITAAKQTAATELHKSANGYLPLIQGAGYYTTAGTISGRGATTTAMTGKISIADYKVSQIRYRTKLGTNAYEIIFWDSSDNILSNISVAGKTSAFGELFIDLADPQYQQVASFAVSAYQASGDFSDFYCIIVHPFDDLTLPSRMETTEDRVAVLQEQVSNLADYRGELLYDGYYKMNGGFTNTTAAKNTGFVEIGKYRYLTATSKISSGAAAFAFFDENKAFIASAAIAGTGSLTTVHIDFADPAYASARFVVVSFYGPSYDGFECILDNDKGKKVLIFGDSITDSATITVNAQNETTAYTAIPKKGSYVNGQGVTVKYSFWSYLISRYIKCSDLRNYALSGASYRTRNPEQGMERQNLVTQLEIAVNDINNPNGVFPTEGAFVPDIIIFALGTNDGTPTGTYDAAMAKTVMNQEGTAVDVDATLANLDTTITCDAIRFAFLKIRKYFPQSLCFCVLPIQRQSTAKPGINDVLEQFAKRYSIKVIDGAAEVGIVQDLETYNTFGANLKDGLHPNEKGQNLMTRAIVTAVRNNWLKEDFLNL